MTLQNISTLLKNGYRVISREFSNRETETSLLINLAKSVLVESVSAVFLTKTACFFAVSLSAASSVSNLAFSIIIANTISRSIVCYLQYRQLQKMTPEYSGGGLDKVTSMAQWIPPLNFSLLFGATGNLLIHEAGHIAAGHLVYRNFKAQITVQGLFRAAVSWTKTGLTTSGNSLGALNARLLVCVAGPLAAVLVGTLIFVAGMHFKDRFPELSRYFALTAVFTVAYQALYALSALWASKVDLGHDFVMLWHVGIHPIVASIFLMSIPLIALSAYQRWRQ